MSKDLVVAFKNQVANSEHEFKAALPAHIPVERFMRVVNTAVVGNPDLLNADRRSLFESAMKAAQDGLLPDSRDGAFVIYGGRVQWLVMIGGLLKKIRNSGELLSISAHVVHEQDEFTYVLGDDEKIEHRPSLGDRGKPILAYAIAKTKDGGIYREVMTVADIEKVRSVSRAKNSGPWVQWWGEMAKKTVIRRLAKRLPMSTDLDDLIRRDDDLYDFDRAKEEARANADRTLAGRLSALAAPAHDAETGEVIEQEIPAEGNASQEAAGADASASADKDWREEGKKAAARGMTARAMPTELRKEGMEQAAEEWRAGHAEAMAEKENANG